MRYAIHSISWGASVDFDNMVEDVINAGYSGIELFQDPTDLGGVKRIERSLCEIGVKLSGQPIELVGICCGTFEERLRFVTEYARIKHKPVSDPSLPYVYFDETFDAEVADALKAGFRIALHPHMYKPIQTLAEAEELLVQNENLLLLPDTAHLRIAGDEASVAIEKYNGRLAAIHMKNWRENVGRSYPFYARGFCELDEEGDVELEKALDAVIRRASQTWIVVEQDRPSRSALDSAKRSRTWLRQRCG